MSNLSHRQREPTIQDLNNPKLLVSELPHRATQAIWILHNPGIRRELMSLQFIICTQLVDQNVFSGPSDPFMVS